MPKKFKTVEKFYNYLCDNTGSTWTGIVQSDTKTIFQDLCHDLKYVDKVKALTDRLEGVEVIGIQDNMIFVLFENKDATDID